MYSTNNEGKSVVAERFIRTLKCKIYKYMTPISKNVYIDKLNAIVNKYNNTYHTTYTSLLMLKIIRILILIKKLIIKILNLKLVIMLKFQSIKTYLLKGICLIGVKKFLL